MDAPTPRDQGHLQILSVHYALPPMQLQLHRLQTVPDMILTTYVTCCEKIDRLQKDSLQCFIDIGYIQLALCVLSKLAKLSMKNLDHKLRYQQLICTLG